MTQTDISYFDTHVHLDMLAPKGVDVDDAIERAFNSGVDSMIAIAGTNDTGTFDETLSIAKKHDSIHVAAGYHPHSASSVMDAQFNVLEKVLEEKDVIAIGEIGLDYFYNHSPKKEQRRIFIKEMRLARKAGLPVIIHTREADIDTMSILQDEGANETGGVIHCFSSTQRLAEQALEMGMFISFSGILTFPKSLPVQEVAAMVPDDRILTETDAPFLSPVPHRGKTNEPARVVHIARKLAEVRGVELSTLARQIVKNTHNCFRF
jgi:TatD DNase family protein